MTAFLNVQVQGDGLKTSQSLALCLYGFCPQRQNRQYSMFLKRQNQPVLPLKRANFALFANAFHKTHLLRRHYNNACRALKTTADAAGIIKPARVVLSTTISENDGAR